MNNEENMTDYNIFDESLPDAYISELTEEELDVLIDEATEEHLRLEKEIDELIWKDTPQIGDKGEPVNKIWPSEMSYLPIFYRDVIAIKPGLEKDLKAADELTQRIGLVLAGKGTAITQQAQLSSLYVSIASTKNDDLRPRVGLVLAVKGTAMTQKSHLSSLYARIARAKNDDLIQ